MKDNNENIEEVFTEMLKYSVDEAFKYCDEGYDETKNPEFLLYKGHAHLVSGEYEEAILSVDKAFELGCDYKVYGYNVKAEALLELGLYVESRRYYERVIELSPDNYIATIFQVELDIREEFYEDAINRAEAYIENYGNNKYEVADLKSAIAWTYMVDLNLPHEGFEYFKEAIELNENCSRAHTGIGIYYNHIKEYEKAIESFIKAIECAPEDGENYFGLAVCYKEIGKFEEVEKNLIMANALLPEDNRILYEFAFELLRQEKKEEAIEMFKEILIYNPDDEEVAGLISSLN